MQVAIFSDRSVVCSVLTPPSINSANSEPQLRWYQKSSGHYPQLLRIKIKKKTKKQKQQIEMSRTMQ